VTVVIYFRSTPLGACVLFKRHTSFATSSCSMFSPASNHLSHRVLKTPSFSMKSMVASMYVILWPPFLDSDADVQPSTCLLPETPRSLNILPVHFWTTMRWVVAPSSYARGSWIWCDSQKMSRNAKWLKKRKRIAALCKQKSGHIHKDSYVHTYQPRRAAILDVARKTARFPKVWLYRERGQPPAPFNRVESMWCHLTVGKR